MDKYKLGIYRFAFSVMMVITVLNMHSLDTANNEISKYKEQIKEQQNIIEILEKKEHEVETEVEEVEETLGNSYVQTVRITHYSSEETGSNITASGAVARTNHTIASNTLPFGTKVKINGIIYTVEDTGDMEGNGIDIYVNDSEEAYNRGTHIVDVEVYKEM